jgi:ribosomal protein S18 acetylase RimI-like enzyme
VIIRQYRPADEKAVYDVCLRTSANGRDGTSLYTDPALPGHAYAGAYLLFQPEYSFILDDGDVAGYVLGALDTREFEGRCEREWWPGLRSRYADPAGVPAPERTPDQRMAHLFHHPAPASPDIVEDYPSHLHIDLLPHAQGRGFGRGLLERLLGALADAGSPGVHLGVSLTNTGAIAFYRRLGFEHLAGDPYTSFMGRTL